MQLNESKIKGNIKKRKILLFQQHSAGNKLSHEFQGSFL